MKNIVICCDGTNNQLETDETNVLRLFRSLADGPNFQIIYYDPGVGTLAQPGYRSQIGKKLSLVYGLAFGVGFTRNLEEAYSFLMQNYEQGDRLFLFGFSRGAYTVRALAGMLDMFGLLDRDQENLVPYVSRAYVSANFAVARKVKNITGRQVSIDFLGLWDTVTSLGFAYKRKALPFTANNKSVRAVRHAMSIDERRSYFRQNRWGDELAATQDIKQVWFAGVHCDVGGGYPEGAASGGPGDDRSALSKITLQWMVEEARKFDLKIDDAKYQRALQGKLATPFMPNPAAVANESLHGPWWIAEFLPMNYTLRHNKFFLPRGRRRKILSGAIVHQSVIDRQIALQNYRPPNLPQIGATEPWSVSAVNSVEAIPPSAPGPSILARVLSPPLGLLGALGILYFLVFLIFLGLRIVAAACLHTDVWRTGSSSFVWPPWFGHVDNASRLLPIAVPLMVFILGSWILGKLSRLPCYEQKINNGRILHKRFGGYDKAVAEGQLRLLKPEGRAAYLRMLRLDLAFPLFYGAALIWGLHSARILAGYNSFSWIELLPLVTVISDWDENLILLWQVPRYRDTRPSGLSGLAIGIASVGTTLKLLTFTAVFLWIIWLLICNLRAT